jgi:hypothetical protein
MSIADRLAEAQEAAGPDPRKMCWYLAGVVQGLHDAAQEDISSGFIRQQTAAPQPPPKDAPDAIVGTFEFVAGIDPDDVD